MLGCKIKSSTWARRLDNEAVTKPDEVYVCTHTMVTTHQGKYGKHMKSFKRIKSSVIYMWKLLELKESSNPNELRPGPPKGRGSHQHTHTYDKYYTRSP